MKDFLTAFIITDERNCPLYEQGEELLLSEKTFCCPKGKEVCLILVRDMTGLLFKFLQDSSGDLAPFKDKVFNCSGCTGLIKFALHTPEGPVGRPVADGAAARVSTTAQKKYGKILDSPFIKIIPDDRVESILGEFKEIQLEKDALLISKGEQNRNLYIVLNGELLVEDGGVCLAELKRGDLCGEMSYLGADVAASTVRAGSAATVLAMEGEFFGRLLGDCVGVQKYMAQLLAKRLSLTNAARAREFESCMSGRIDEIVPAELFQIFHMHQKTGVLNMDLSRGEARVSFREGCIINAAYNGRDNQEAIFKILAEKKGLYRFTSGLSPHDMRAGEIGDFMMLLMEGVKRVDEEQGHGGR